MKHHTKTLWEGKQWVVTDYGIERRCVEGGYPYEMKKEDLNINGDYISPQHIAGKRWADLDEFILAWFACIVIHKLEIKDVSKVMELVDKARRKRALSIKRAPIFDAVYEEWFPDRVNGETQFYNFGELEAICREVDRRMREDAVE